MNVEQLTPLANKVIENVRDANSVVVSVGPQLAVDAGVPSWSTLAARLSTTLRQQMPIDYDQFTQTAAAIDIVRLFSHIFGRDHLVAEIRAFTDNLDPIELHKAVAQLPAKAFLTANYDNLLERAVSSQGNQYSVITDDNDLEKPSRIIDLMIYKLRGTLDRPESLVLTSEDFANFPNYKSTIESRIGSMLATSLVLLVGYSPEDEELQRLYRLYGRYSVDGTWVLFAHDVDPLTRDLWLNRGVRLIDLAEDELPALLRLLATKLKLQIKKSSETPLLKRPRTAGRKIRESLGKNQIFLSAPNSAQPLVAHLRASFKKSRRLNLVAPDDIQGNGLSVWDKFEQIVSKSSAAIVLLTPQTRVIDGRLQSGQNAIFELGYLTAKLGKNRVLVIIDKEAEVPPEMVGISYVISDQKYPDAIVPSVKRWFSATGLGSRRRSHQPQILPTAVLM
jgi:SIR2-like domain/Predicted nucleotide-binding protein containing TIR-like domain